MHRVPIIRRVGERARRVHLFAGSPHAVHLRSQALDTTVGVSFQVKEAGTRRHRFREVVGRGKARSRRPPFERRVKRGHAHPFARCPCAVQLKPLSLKPFNDTMVNVSFQFKEADTRRHRLREMGGRVNAREWRPPFERRVKKGDAHPCVRCPHAIQLKP
jgi:hypothetical protein